MRSSPPISTRPRSGRLARGERLTEILKQGQYVPAPVEQQVVVLYAAVNGFVDDIEVWALRQFEKELVEFIAGKKPELLRMIRDKREITDEIKGILEKALQEFKAAFTPAEKK